ncbi:hypothetical protein [Vibrio alfacsensis]
MTIGKDEASIPRTTAQKNTTGYPIINQGNVAQQSCNIGGIYVYVP